MPIEQHDIAGHRSTPQGIYTKADFVRRVMWAGMAPLFRSSPRHLYGWRNFMLRRFGAQIGRGVRIYPTARIFAPWKLRIGDEVTVGWDVRIYNLADVVIGDRCIVSQNAHLCAGNHDHRQSSLPFTNRPIVVESDCWICTDAFVGSGVRIGRLAVIGARAVVVRDVAPRAVMVGNPAKLVSQR